MWISDCGLKEKESNLFNSFANPQSEIHIPQLEIPQLEIPQ
jgi:hypothetical protein